MDLTKGFVAFAQLGADWVLWLLIGLSVLSIGVMIDRAMWFRHRLVDAGQLARELRGALARGEVERFEAKYKDAPSAAAQVALRGLAERGRGAEAVAEAMHGERLRWRGAADKNLVVLGTLGNNVPFVGLFGTVLGVVDAFEHLRQHTPQAEDETLDLIARALAATAFGLLVAIPAVVAYNFFTRKRAAMLAAADECAHALLAELQGDDAPAAPAKAGDGGS